MKETKKERKCGRKEEWKNERRKRKTNEERIKYAKSSKAFKIEERIIRGTREI